MKTRQESRMLSVFDAWKSLPCNHKTKGCQPESARGWQEEPPRPDQLQPDGCQSSRVSLVCWGQQRLPPPDCWSHSYWGQLWSCWGQDWKRTLAQFWWGYSSRWEFGDLVWSQMKPKGCYVDCWHLGLTQQGLTNQWRPKQWNNLWFNWSNCNKIYMYEWVCTWLSIWDSPELVMYNLWRFVRLEDMKMWEWRLVTSVPVMLSTWVSGFIGSGMLECSSPDKMTSYQVANCMLHFQWMDFKVENLALHISDSCINKYLASWQNKNDKQNAIF